MNDLTQIIDPKPIISLLIAFGLIMLGRSSLRYLFFLPIKMFLRSRNIKNQGWPPPHLDADGDFKPDSDDDEDE